MAQDFLITFSVDGTQAIRDMEKIGAAATKLESQLNAGRGGRGGGGGSFVGSLERETRSAISGVDRLQQRMADLRGEIGNRRALGLPISAGTFDRAALAARELAANLPPLSSKFKTLTAEAESFAASGNAVRASLGQTNDAFSRHTHRILEAIIIYEAFGRAIQAVVAGVNLIVDINRETQRLEAVLQTGPTDSAKFVKDLGQIASDTVTPFEHLVSEADRMGAAFLDVEDPVKRAADALTFARAAGQFTTVTQRDLGVETTNLIAIMKQLNIPVEDLDDTLGKIVVAGGNSSTIIAGLADALQISSRAAAQAGVDLDTLLAIESEFLIQTGRGGSEVGNLFKLLFQRLSDPDVVKSVDAITGGLLKMRDAAGAIRDPIQILQELNALFANGVITATQFKDVIDTFAPPLNPAAKADFILITDLLNQIGPRVEQIEQASSDQLTNLVNKINDALGPKFQKLIIDAQRAFVEMFSDDVVDGGESFIRVIRELGTALGALPAGLLETIIKFGTMTLALLTLKFVLGSVLGLLGAGGLVTTLATVLGAAAGWASTFTAASAASTLFGKALIFTTASAAGLLSVMAPLLVAIAAFLALDFAGKVEDSKDSLRTQIGEKIQGMNREELLAFRQRVEDQIVPDSMLGVTSVANPTLRAALEEIDRQLAIIGEDGEVTGARLSVAFGGAGQSATDTMTAVREGTSAYEEGAVAADRYAESIRNIPRAQAAEETRLLTTLLDEEAGAFRRLDDRLRDGTITQAQWNAGQSEVHRASELSSELVSVFGEDLRTLIPELADAAEGNEGLASALFEMLITSGDASGQLAILFAMAISTKNGMFDLANMVAIAASKFDNLALSAFRGAEGIDAANRAAARGQFLRTQGSKETLDDIFNRARQLFASIGSSTFGTAPTPKAAPAPKAIKQTGIFDINDLPTSELAKLIAMATALRNAIPGETAASKDELVALVKDAKFLQTVKGIDEKLLRLALEQLTKAMQEANDLAKAEKAILTNLQVNAGPLGALISAPTLFGAGGSIPAGLNFDPDSPSPFTINIDIGNVTEMSPAQLQAAIEAAVRNAIIAGLRGQGVST